MLPAASLCAFRVARSSSYASTCMRCSSTADSAAPVSGCFPCSMQSANSPNCDTLPLVPRGDDILTATRVGAIGSLPLPRRQDVEYAPLSKDWYWQPTAMDIAADNLAALIMTYRAVYVYRRNVDDTWFAALSRRPLVIDLRGYREAEAAVFSADSESIFVTVEQRHAPLLRIDLNGATAE